jgi:arylsulfatase A-like enzyme
MFLERRTRRRTVMIGRPDRRHPTGPSGRSVRVVTIAVACGLAAAGTIAISACRETSPGTASADGPANVLLITLDTTRADRLGCYGYDGGTSPNIDALAADAVRFERAMATAAVTPISHASILTGRYPHHHSLRVFYGPIGHFLPDDQPTLATILAARGWQTGAFISAYPASERFGLDQGFESYETGVAASVMKRDPRKRLPREVQWARQRTAMAQRRADATTDDALAWLEQAHRPFFAWVHYFDPHDASLIPPEEVTDRFAFSRRAPNPKASIYDPEIFFMDANIGRLMEWLEVNGEYENSIIVIVSDHGQGLGDHGWQQHRLLYQEQIRTPLIIRTPNGPRGRVVGAVASSIDIAPTILAAAGVAIPDGTDGHDLLAAADEEDGEQRIVLAEALNTLDTHAPRKLPAHQKDLLFCAIDRRWKLIYHRDHPENSELYDLASDPRESTNVIARHPEEKERLLRRLSESGAMVIDSVAPDAPEADESIRMLESLGYIHGNAETPN